MENSTLKKILIPFALIPIGLMAQPILTATGINPVIGDVLTTNTAQYVSPGSGGAGQTWNLGFTSSGATAQTGVAPSSTPYGSSFPTASVAFGPTTYVYYKTSSSAYQMNGVVNSSGTVIAYSNVEDLLRFPFAYTDSYTDSWSATFVSASYTYYRTGNTTVTADGWGTLTTPAGTFVNVMRVHLVQVYQDSTNISSTPFVITYNNDEYAWYLNGNHNAIAAVYTLTTSAGGPFTGGLYLDNVVNSIEEQNSISALSLYPNPANDHVNLSYTLTDSRSITFSVYDASGKVVEAGTSSQAQEGENSILISVAELPDGIYFATVTSEGNLPVARRFTVTH
jgi:hypothetical protein